jgi:3-phosphoshikimate 1-carboxyvinyltransferase
MISLLLKNRYVTDMSDVTIEPLVRPFNAKITPPGSKSLTNRALVIAALADGVCELSNVLFADDTQHMLDNLAKLGFHLEIDHSTNMVRVHGLAGKIPSHHAELFCGNSGTTIRFLTALCTLGKGTFTLDGVARMRQRPIAALTGLLKNLGARVSHSPEAEGFPPVQIDADGLGGGIVRYGSEASSQFLSAVLMVAPYARHEVRVDLEPHQTSWPYIAMTMQLMDHFHITPELIRDPQTHEPKQIIVPQGTYKATNYIVEPDASNASYFLAAAAINPGSKITLEGLGKSSLQGDVGFADVLHRMGAEMIFGRDFITIKGPEKLTGIDVDLQNMPDIAQTLAVACGFAVGPSTLRGLHTLRVKETDRIAALSNELKKLGCDVDVESDAMTITPPNKIKSAAIDTYDDHRMAMSFAVAGTRAAGITIKNAECVNKTYPQFFDDLKKITTHHE